MTEYTSLKIKQLMKAKNIGNKALAEASGVPLGTLNKIIYGDTKSPTLDNMQAIARVLGCTLDDFVPDANTGAGYYLDPEVAAYAQELFDNPELRVLMDATRDVTKEDLEFITQMVMKLKQNKND